MAQEHFANAVCDKSCCLTPAADLVSRVVWVHGASINDLEGCHVLAHSLTCMLQDLSRSAPFHEVLPGATWVRERRTLSHGPVLDFILGQARGIQALCPPQILAMLRFFSHQACRASSSHVEYLGLHSDTPALAVVNRCRHLVANLRNQLDTRLLTPPSSSNRSLGAPCGYGYPGLVPIARLSAGSTVDGCYRRTGALSSLRSPLHSAF